MVSGSDYKHEVLSFYPLTAQSFIAQTGRVFIITLSLSPCDLINVEKDVKHQTVIITVTFHI